MDKEKKYGKMQKKLLVKKRGKMNIWKK